MELALPAIQEARLLSVDQLIVAVPSALLAHLPLLDRQHVLIVHQTSTRLVPPQVKQLLPRVLYVLQVMQGLSQIQAQCLQLVVAFALLAHMPQQVNHLAHLALVVHFPHLQANLLVLEPTLVMQDRKQSQVLRH